MKVGAVILGLCICLACTGCFKGSAHGGYVVDIDHAKELVMTRGITPASEKGHVFADDPRANDRDWYAWAEVTTEDGAPITNPTIQWTTDLDSIEWQPKSNGAILVCSKPGSIMGRGRLFATYENTTAEMSVFVYGLFDLILQVERGIGEGWNFANRQIVRSDNADIHVDHGIGGSIILLHAPYGIKPIGSVDPGDINAFFEDYPTATIDGFTQTVQATLGDICEVVGNDGTHYKIAVLMIDYGTSGPDERYEVEFAWDYYH